MREDFDYIDGVLLGAVFIGAVTMAGIGSFDLFDVTLSDQAFSIGEGVTIAMLLTLGGLTGTVVTNDNASLSADLVDDVQDLEQKYYVAVLATLALMVGWVFVADVSSFVTSSDLWGVLYVLGTVMAQIALGWML